MVNDLFHHIITGQFSLLSVGPLLPGLKNVFLCSFKANATRVSRLLKDRRRTPLQETADWIEYVLRHGGARHLRPEVSNITWYQYYLLDVALFLAVILVLVIKVVQIVCRFVCGMCGKIKKNKMD